MKRKPRQLQVNSSLLYDVYPFMATHIKIRGNRFTLLAERALYWENEKVLICSDVHWGREILLQKFGMPVPERSFEQDSIILEEMFKTTGAKEWWILGDLIHHPQGLEKELVEKMSQWMAAQLTTKLKHIRFVPGNHDRNFLTWAHAFPFEIERHGITKNNFRFLHEPFPISRYQKDDMFSWCGHIHPAFASPMMGQKKLPCFWIQKDRGYIPAFSRLAGGLSIQPKQTDKLFVIAEKQVVQIY